MAASIRLTLDECVAFAQSKNGRCLTEEYKNNQTKMRWECEHGHEWEASFANIKCGTWCPVCAGNVKLKLSDAQKFAETKGGKCLSTEYVGIDEKMHWECEYGHEWEAVYSSIKAGRWCPVCAGNVKLKLSDAQKFAETKGGKCLSTEYVNANAKMSWECKYGHTWEATFCHVKIGTWCPVCAGNVKLELSDAQKFAETKGGKCLSTEYVGIDEKMRWECEHGHEWEASAYSVLRAQNWCPVCAGNVKLELSDAQKFAETKGGKCLSNDYVNNKTPLLWACKHGHEWEAVYGSIKAGTWCPVCAYINSKGRSTKKLSIWEAREMATLKGGKCLSDRYVNNKTNMLWECERGHKWESRFNSIKRGQWCPECAGVKKHTFSDVLKFAASKGGRCLSNDYVNSKVPLLWECKRGHQRSACFKTVKKVWCRICEKIS